MIEVKRCPQCEEVKPIAEFNRNAARYNGIDSYCGDCMRQRGRDRDAKRRKHIDDVPPERQCAVDGCPDRRRGRGYCNKHLKRFREHGDPLAGRQRKAEVRTRRRPNGLTLEESFRWFQPGDPPPPGVLWPWGGTQDDKGYGIVRHGGRNVLAHRISYEMFVGPIPDGLVVRHKNDTPLDVNPHNLELGTLLDNVRDRVNRGRTHVGPRRAKGSSVALARLTEADIPNIRTAFASGTKQKDLAVQYGVTQGAISGIVNRRTWKHVP